MAELKNPYQVDVPISYGGDYYRSIDGLTRTLRILLSSYIVLRILSSLFLALTMGDWPRVLDSLNYSIGTISMVIQAVSMLVTLTLVIIGATSLLWIYRAHSNLPALGARNLSFSPGAAVGWFFVPIANLWKPFQAMRQLHCASQQPEAWEEQSAPGSLIWWWLTYVLAYTIFPVLHYIILGILVGMGNTGSIPLVMMAMSIPGLIATFLFLHLISSINRSQKSAFQRSMAPAMPWTSPP